MADYRISVDVGIDGQGKLDALEKQIKNIQNTKSINIKLNIDGAEALASISKTLNSISKSTKSATVKVPVDFDIKKNTLNAQINQALTQVKKLGSNADIDIKMSDGSVRTITQMAYSLEAMQREFNAIADTKGPEEAAAATGRPPPARSDDIHHPSDTSRCASWCARFAVCSCHKYPSIPSSHPFTDAAGSSPAVSAEGTSPCRNSFYLYYISVRRACFPKDSVLSPRHSPEPGSGTGSPRRKLLFQDCQTGRTPGSAPDFRSRRSGSRPSRNSYCCPGSSPFPPLPQTASPSQTAPRQSAIHRAGESPPGTASRLTDLRKAAPTPACRCNNRPQSGKTAGPAPDRSQPSSLSDAYASGTGHTAGEHPAPPSALSPHIPQSSFSRRRCSRSGKSWTPDNPSASRRRPPADKSA